MSSPLVVYSTADHDAHETPPWHPEHHSRLTAAVAGITEADLGDATEWRVPPEADVADLERVHDPAYVARLGDFCERGGGQLDADTIASVGSYLAARRAAGGALAGIEALRAGECDVAFVAARPPGHQAVLGGSMGLCLFTNVAVAAAKLDD
ncbi:MAG: hypothetical protein MUE78_07525, partial [Ilumatobacteraceae bacterium]|nr:hypothetical protein [Ilumatobacteraceae bacterium]